MTSNDYLKSLTKIYTMKTDPGVLVHVATVKLFISVGIRFCGFT